MSTDRRNILGVSKQHSTFICDVANSNQVEKLKEYAREHWNRAPNIVVNSAGLSRDSTLLNLDEEKFDEIVDVNLKGVYLVCIQSSIL